MKKQIAKSPRKVKDIKIPKQNQMKCGGKMKKKGKK